MRHHNVNRKFGRVRKVRKALINSLARSLVLYEKIETTEAKAKELRPFAEKLITKGKLQTVAARRAITAIIGPKATKIVVNGNGITFGYPNQPLAVAARSKIQRKSFPDFKMVVLDSSGSMAEGINGN
ncbi:MAG: 50S ribosomal protein L17, partial [Parcubacteria group bacterium GW2011_GWC1_34_10]